MKELKKGWKRVKLGEIIEIKMGQSPKSEYYNSNGKGMPFLQGNRTFGYRYPYYDTYCTENKKIAKKNSVIMSVRAPVGDLNLIDRDISIGRGVCALNSKNGENLFLYYLMKGNIEKLINRESGTVFGSVNKNDILGLEVIVPSLLSEQKEIASILSSLDDKIELNNEMNKTLEEMAQTLFKQWFIDFEFPNENGEPYKSSGGKMVESELGKIPEGWEVGPFRELIKETIGGDWGKEISQGNYIEEVFCVRGTDIIDSTKGNFEKVPKRFILNKNFQNKKLLCGDMIVEISGGSPTQSTGRIGYINKIILENFNHKLITTNFCRIMRPYNLEETAFIYNYWRLLYNMTIFFQFENGTTGIKNLDLNGFLDGYIIVRPPSEKIKKYTQIVDKLNIHIQENGKETKNLTKIRDTLLPMLMSGEIEV